MPVLGVGGFFFRAQDPETLNAWYRDHLGVGAGCAAEGTGPADEWSWTVQGGPLVFAPFEAGTDYWAPVNPDSDSPEVGRFARIHDPEGNAIELWEPPPAPAP
jgi:hypothetical protein